MERDFWLERWERNETGFHQDEINPHLKEFWPRLGAPQGGGVFVPLCGKTLDLLWLREAGHRVTGVELSPIAVRDFFVANGMRPDHSRQGAFECCEADEISILCGDFFDLGEDELRGVEAVYDRASLVALPPQMRGRYAAHLGKLLKPGTKILLIAFDYDQEQMKGPPFAVSPGEVDSLFGGFAAVERLASFDVLDRNPRFSQLGLTRLTENVYRLTRLPVQSRF